MTDDKRKPPEAADSQPTDDQIEAEIRSRRKFSIAEAIGRGAGDLMKGASPVTRKQQTEFEVEELIDRFLEDSEGALAVVLLQRVKASEELLGSYGAPIVALTRVVEAILDSDESLGRFVTKVDAEWGRMYFERPHFDTADRPPHRDDPYTLASVQETLAALLETIRSQPDIDR